jgi:hypothetical protein
MSEQPAPQATRGPVWSRVVSFFKDSETIFIARLKVLIGGLFLAVNQAGIDVTEFGLDHKYQTVFTVACIWLAADGTLGEWARRRRDTL